MTPSLLQKSELLLSECFGKRIIIESMHPVGGGCINDCFELITPEGKFFLKKNDPGKFPKMFEYEAAGIELLNNVVSGIAPRVIYVKEEKMDMFLFLEWIEKGTSKSGFWNDFAKKLSLIHYHSHDSFGLGHDNYMGSLLQHNDEMNDWISFFILRRIEPQLKMAIDNGNLPKEVRRSFEKLFTRLTEIFPVEKPSLIHGDLWSGNYMVGGDGNVRLIDPAVNFGYREADLSMTRLFGGFDRSFYVAYEEFFPLEPGFSGRIDIYNLYPLLIHVNLFGGHYARQVISIVRAF